VKKAVTVFLAAVLLTSMIGTTVLAEDIDTVYVDQNFDDAALGFDIYDGTLTDGEKYPINVLNHATGLNMPWMTVVQNWDGTQWLEYSDLLEVGTNPDETTNYAIALPPAK
jgi:hypothetical protein